MSFNVCFGRFIYYNYSQRSYRYKSVFDTLFIVSLVVYLISWSYIWSYLDHRLTLKFEWERPLLNLFFKWNLFQNSFLWGGGSYSVYSISSYHVTSRVMLRFINIFFQIRKQVCVYFRYFCVCFFLFTFYFILWN